MTASDIIDALGGTSIVATALGCPVSTVHSWRTSNSIPRWRQSDLLSLAVEKGAAIAATDFPIRQRVAA